MTSFNVTQNVSGSTQEHGHSRDLVFTLDSISDIEICGNIFSDHMPLLFNIAAFVDNLGCHLPFQTGLDY